MTISEFKAFLEGMGVSEQPTKEQWARIAEKIETLEAYKMLEFSTSPTPFETGIPYAPMPVTTC